MFKVSWGGQKQGLKNGPVWSIVVDQFATGPDHRLDHFFLDWTNAFWTGPHTGPLFFWTRPHTGPPNIPNFLGGSVHFSGPICNWTGPRTGQLFYFLKIVIIVLEEKVQQWGIRPFC